MRKKEYKNTFDVSTLLLCDTAVLLSLIKKFYFGELSLTYSKSKSGAGLNSSNTGSIGGGISSSSSSSSSSAVV